VFIKVPEIEAAFVPEPVPVIPANVGADQEYVVPVGTILPEPFVGASVNADPEQLAAVCAITEGVGLTVTVTENDVPTHVPLVGVTV
jgi:hypothetical protein